MLKEEKRDFLAAREFLTRLRSHMHLVSGRRTDQLYFEQQADVAGALGYHSKSEPRNVEEFMHDVYDALQTLGVATDLFFDHVDEVLGLVVGESKISDKIVEKGIEIKAGAVLLTATQQQLQAKPQTLIRVLLVMSRTGLPMHHRSRKAIPGLVNLITEKERRSPRFAKTFFALLLEAKDISTLLETMLETGLLAACIPEFLRISCLVQHDLYHIYTVDRHSVQAVAGLHELVAKWDNVVKDVKNVKILYLATLLHDIGKGSGRDHSLEGADLVKAIGKRLCLSEQECEALSFLVRYHLFIPENALRRDLNDTVFIKRCGETIGELELLAMLYLLSVSDSKATGPSAWSDWKSALMEELYLKVYPYLDLGRNGVQDAVAHEQEGVQWLREQIRVQLKGNYDLKIDPEELSTDYILSFAPEDIASHLLTQRDYYSKIRQKSLIAVDEENEHWSLLIMTADRPGLLAKICGVLTLNNLSVSKAQIFTWCDGTVVDVIDVKATDGLSFGEKDWQGLNEQLDLAIEHKMGLSHRLYKKLPSAYGRKMQMVGEVASKVVIDNESSDVYSVIEVYAPDIPGQLYYITQAMADFGINIHKAYIATEVEQLIDVFYVLDSGGQKLLDLEFQQEITSGILHSIFYPTGN